ncbi:GNAT family N-acetyltransferase [Bacillus sp. SB49]|uniref:GNAT family N-acetyltransferase n=1 Tax=Bacillaceae TaxID=186817 RepID=UPI0004045058|nr:MULTISPECIES: GNAT family N-acetyltransferase [Bacillaceae]QHT46273.1 GNAT family N-acetyltransferase [Bacillus sp. SB49]
MKLEFRKITAFDETMVAAYNRWENDRTISALARPHKNQASFEKERLQTVDTLTKRLEDHEMYAIMLDGVLVGEMNFMIDPEHLFRKEKGSGWIGITIGEAGARGKGIGAKAILFMEEEMKKMGLKRVELGVFEFNESAHRLYSRLGYKEIAREEGFTYYDGRMWADIRMEKPLSLTAQ